MNNADLAKRWFDKAEYDLRIASHLDKTMYPKPVAGICYHCQQATEKALKGFLIFHGVQPPYTHKLLQLCQMCAEIEVSFQKSQDTCSRMTVYATTTRYPEDEEFDETDASFALKETERIYAFCIGLIPELTQEQEQEPAQNPEQSM